jgi:hypothetical protein
MEKYIKQALRENLLKEGFKLSIEESKILDELLSKDLNEGTDIGWLLSKFKSYAKQGAITAGIVLSLLSTDAIGQEQKQQILNTAQEQLSDEEITKVQNALDKDLGLKFDKDYIGNNFAVVDDEKPFNLPSQEEIKGLITKAGLPSRFIENVYVNYSPNAQGNDHAGVVISVRLRDADNLKRMAQPALRKKVQRLVINALQGYKNTLKGNDGEAVAISLEVLDPNGSMLGGRPVHIKG